MSRKAESAEADPARSWPAERIEHWPIERLIPLLVVLVLVHFSHLEDLAHDLRLETFGFGVDFLDVLTERPLLLLDPLDALVMLPPQQGGDDSLRARLAQGRDAVTRASEFRASAAA
jgi:hypothetical protein